MNSLELRKAELADLSSIIHLLKQCHLPTEGITSELFFAVVKDGEDIVGCAGYEKYEPFLLLRSVAVHPNYRCLGLGHRLVQSILEHAKNQGYQQSYLLTTTAENFFFYLGFQKIDRVQVPQQVQNSIEFSTLCPSSAVVMEKIL